MLSQEIPLMIKKRNRNIYKLITTIPDDVDHFSEISKAQILNTDWKAAELFQEFLSEESCSEIGRNISKYTNLFKNMASRLIFMTIFLLSPVFSKK